MSGDGMGSPGRSGFGIHNDPMDFLFCNDPVCEADNAVDTLEERIKTLEAKVFRLATAIDDRDRAYAKLEAEYERLVSGGSSGE